MKRPIENAIQFFEYEAARYRDKANAAYTSILRMTMNEAADYCDMAITLLKAQQVMKNPGDTNAP